MGYLQKVWRNNRGLLLFVVLMSLFRSVIADWNHVPSGSMEPSILVGDRILVDKLAYDLCLSFTHISLMQLDQPKRGDIVIFESAVADERLVKRLIALPGDRVAMRDNRLWLNGEWLNYRKTEENAAGAVLSEDLGGHTHPVHLLAKASQLSNFGPLTVPQGRYLVLGDNRDNSADSRVIGFVPRDEIVGRAVTVVVSLNEENYYLPRRDRLWQALP
jgi:signal peptidase I